VVSAVFQVILASLVILALASQDTLVFLDLAERQEILATQE